MNKNTKITFLLAMIIGITSVQTLPIVCFKRPLAVAKRIGKMPLFRIGKKVLMPVVRHCATHKKLSCFYAASIAAVGAVATSFHVPWTWNKWLRVGARFPRFTNKLFRVSYFFGKNPEHDFVDAVSKGDLPRMQLLRGLGIGVNARDKGGNTALHVVPDVELAQQLLGYGADIAARNQKGCQPLHKVVSSEGRKSAIVDLFIQSGAECNALNTARRTPLHKVASGDLEDKAESIRLLLNNGADAKAIARFSRTAAEVAYEKKRPYAIVRQLFDAEGKTLYFAARESRIGSAMFDIFLNAEASDVTVPSGDGGLTALHCAAHAGNIDAINKLIERHADVNALGGPGQASPLHMALSHRHNDHQAEVVRILLHNGADVNIGDGNGRTALHLAVGEGNIKAVRILLQNGVDPNVVDHNGRTALHYCCDDYRVFFDDRLAIFGMLIDEGHAHVNVRDANGITPLMLLITSGVLRDHRMKNVALRLIPLCGARVAEPNLQGDTLLAMAVARSEWEIVKALIAEYERADIIDQIDYDSLLACAQKKFDCISENLLIGNAIAHGITISANQDVQENREHAQALIDIQMEPRMLAFTQAMGSASPASVLPPELFQGIWNSLTGRPAE